MLHFIYVSTALMAVYYIVSKMVGQTVVPVVPFKEKKKYPFGHPSSKD